MKTTKMSAPLVFALALPVFAVAPLAPAAHAAPSADGGVDSVLVFADRARVTRARTARCEGGTARAVFEGLPVALDARTLRGEVRETADVIGLGAEVVNTDGPTGERAPELFARQEKLAADARAREARKAALAAELDDVNAYAGVLAATVGEEMRNPRPDTAAWGKALEALRARRVSLDDERRKADVALRALRREQDEVAARLRALGDAGKAARATRTVSVTVGCRALPEVTALLSYVVPGATWQPVYDLDFTPRGRGPAKVGPGTARLTVGAIVRQSSGEDWPSVTLSFSTARPKLGAEAPRPAPLVVDGYENARDKVMVQAYERRDRLAAGGAARAPAGAAAATLDDKGNAFVLTLPHRVSVSADGRPVWAPVDAVETAAASKLVAVAKLDEHVYQVVAFKNPAAYPLLDGRVRSYRAGSYIGDAALTYHGVGEPVEVSLGPDDELRVERQVLDEKTRDPSLLGSTRHLLRAYRTVVRSRASGPETVELRENLPVAQIDDVKVELLAKQTTPGYQLDARRGFLTWSLPLASGEEKSVDLGYAIHLPESWQVNGVR